MSLTYESFSELLEIAKKENKMICEIVIEDQCIEMKLSRSEIIEKMRERYHIMLDSMNEGLKEGVKSVSGISGGDARKLYNSIGGASVCGDSFTRAIAIAMAVNEHNASMGKIVACPTAGSCGILPGALIGLSLSHDIDEDEVVKSMFTASFVGMVVAKKASVSGAEGGCQAECGTASAMAAAAVCELLGGTPEMCVNAVAFVIKNVLGLVCDPVAGLVEAPCIKRNASGVATAYMAVQLALAGIKSIIPTDETVQALKRVGDNMSTTLKETAEGGLAVTPTGCSICSRVHG